MRFFKVYNADESDHELVFAKNHWQASSIARTIWRENGYRCRHFKVVELCLPASVQEGREPGGLVYEPARTPKEIRWKGKSYQVASVTVRIAMTTCIGLAVFQGNKEATMPHPLIEA
jgi:hypothetical protein